MQYLILFISSVCSIPLIWYYGKHLFYFYSFFPISFLNLLGRKFCSPIRKNTVPQVYLFLEMVQNLFFLQNFVVVIRIGSMD